MKALDRFPISAIAIPVGLEFVFRLVLNFANQVAVGTLGADAIAAVGYANSLIFIGMLTFGALGTSVSILVARAFGGGRNNDMSQTLSVAISMGALLAAITAIVPICFPSQLLQLTGASASVAELGTPYLRLISISLIPVIITMALSGAMRSSGHARSPMFATFLSLPVQTGLAYALVLGLGPFPKLGVVGAGYASLAASIVNLLILGLQAYLVYRVVVWELPGHAQQWGAIVRPLIVLALPLAITEFFWTTGGFLYNVLFQRLGNKPLAAAQITASMEGIFIVASIGLMAATTALVGRALGAGDAEAAQRWVARLKRVGVYTSLVFGGLLALSAFTVPLLFRHAGAEVQRMAMVGIVIYGVSQIVKVRNMILGGGVLPSGSDVRGVIYGDVFGAFAVGLPCAWFLGFHTPLAATGIFIARVLEEVSKWFIFEDRARRVQWTTIAQQQSVMAEESA